MNKDAAGAEAEVSARSAVGERVVFLLMNESGYPTWSCAMYNSTKPCMAIRASM